MDWRWAAALSMPLVPVAAHAADTPANLGEVVVTATRTARTADETLQSVSVITREEILRRRATSVQEVLRGVPGLAVTNTGGLGQNTSVFLRGTDSSHTLVLIDGLRINSATLGTAGFENLPIDQIERIEVVRGPRSSLYGSEAIGGVIQIFTRKGAARGLTPAFSAGLGSHGLYKVNAGVSGGQDGFWFNADASRLATDGFNACKGPDPVGFAGCGTLETDRDGYVNNAGNLRLGYRFAGGTEVEGHLLHSEGRNSFDQIEFDTFSETFRNFATFVQQTAGGKLKYAPTADWLMTVQAGRSLSGLTSYNTATDASRFDTERVTTTWQNDFTLAPNQLLTVGLDYYHDQITSTEVYSEQDRHNTAPFAQFQGSAFGHDLTLGYRHDENSQFGGWNTGNVSWGYTFNDFLRVTAGWGRAFKAPTFNDLYFPRYGDPNLKPEDSESWEVGANGKWQGVRWSLHGYHTEIDNLIVPTQVASGVFRAVNIGASRILGLESTVGTRILDCDINVTYTLLDPRSRGAENPDRLLPRRAPQMFRLDIDRTLGDWSTGLTVYAEGRRFDDVENRNRLGGYLTLDLRAGWHVHKHWQLEARVSNLLDKDYETARLYNQDGRNFFIALRYTPDSAPVRQ